MVLWQLVLLIVAEQTGRPLGRVTIDQVARALNVVWRRWLDGRRGVRAIAHVAEVVRYHQR